MELTFNVRDDPSRGAKQVTAYDGQSEVGVLFVLDWRSDGAGMVIEDIEVRKDRRREGIATAMLEFAEWIFGEKIDHSFDRSDTGEAWAQSLGVELETRTHGFGETSWSYFGEMKQGSD